MKSYDELFQFRGSSYDTAMQAFPGARDQEFFQVLRYAMPEAGMVVADVPAGGGYLKQYLPEGAVWRPHEPCSSFTNHKNLQAEKTDTPLCPLPWEHCEVDVLVSIAGIHHVDDKLPLFREFFRVVRPGGKLVISDVAEDSPVAEFLDEYVGKYNSTGHDGVFLNAETVGKLEEAGWVYDSSAMEKFFWVFDDRHSMALFCHGLFDICKTEPEHTIAEIESRLGVVELSDGRVGMKWELMTVSSVKSEVR